MLAEYHLKALCSELLECYSKAINDFILGDLLRDAVFNVIVELNWPCPKDWMYDQCSLTWAGSEQMLRFSIRLKLAVSRLRLQLCQVVIVGILNMKASSKRIVPMGTERKDK